jgi:hypothetical protein
LFGLLYDILEILVPNVEFLTGLPALHIRPSVEPCRDSLQPTLGIVGTTVKLDNQVKLIFLPAAAAVASVCLDCFLDEGIQEPIEFVLSIPRNDELPSPLGVLTTMLFLTESLLHLFRSKRLKSAVAVSHPLEC